MADYIIGLRRLSHLSEVLPPLRSWVWALYRSNIWSHMGRVCRHSAESHGFYPGCSGFLPEEKLTGSVSITVFSSRLPAGNLLIFLRWFFLRHTTPQSALFKTVIFITYCQSDSPLIDKHSKCFNSLIQFRSSYTSLTQPQLVPRTDAYKMAATTVLVLYSWCGLSVGACNTTIFFEKFTFLCLCRLYTVRVIGQKIR